MSSDVKGEALPEGIRQPLSERNERINRMVSCIRTMTAATSGLDIIKALTVEFPDATHDEVQEALDIYTALGGVVKGKGR